MKKGIWFAALVSVLSLCGCGDGMKQAESSLSADADDIIRKVIVGELDEFINDTGQKRLVRTGDLTICIFNEPEKNLEQSDHLLILGRRWTGMRVEKKIVSSLRFGKITKSKKGVCTCVVRVDVETYVTKFNSLPGVRVGMLAGAERSAALRKMEGLLLDEKYDLAIILATQPGEQDRSSRMVPLRWDPASGHWCLQNASLSPVSGCFSNESIVSFGEWGDYALEREMQTRGMKAFKGVYFSSGNADILQRLEDGYVYVNGQWVKLDVAQQTEAIGTALRNFSRGTISLAQLRAVIAMSPRASNLTDAVAVFVARSVQEGDICNFFGAYASIANFGNANHEAVGLFEKARAEAVRNFINQVSGYSDADFAKKYPSLKKDILSCKMSDSERRECFSAMRTKLSHLMELYRKEDEGFAAIPVNQRISRSLMDDFRKSAVSSLLEPKYAELKELFCIAAMFEYDYRYSIQVSRQASEDVRKRLRRAMPCDMCKGEGRVDCRVCGGSGECKHCRGSGRREVPDFDGKTRFTSCPAKCNVCHGNGRIKCPYCGGDNFYIKGRGRVEFINTLRREIAELLQSRIASLEKEIAAIDNDTVSADSEDKSGTPPPETAASSTDQPRNASGKDAPFLRDEAPPETPARGRRRRIRFQSQN